jgi:hypothetical protein
MYQFILSGSTKDEYQATMKKLMQHIRTKCRAEYIGGYEVGAEKNGLHCHMFVIIETAHYRPADLLDVREGQWIARRIKRKKLSIRIEPPKNRMHGGQMFARMNTPEKLADCIKWCSYHVKARSKDDVMGREIYFGSEFVSNIAKREEQRQKRRDALTKSNKPTLTKGPNDESRTTETSDALPLGSTADQERASSTEAMVRTGQPTSASEEGRSQHEASLSNERYSAEGASPYYESPEMRLTAAQKYACGLYEQVIGRDMDVEEIRRYLLSKGIVRTPGTVKYELEHVFSFTGYAASHPPTPQPSMAEWLRAGRSGIGRVFHQTV